MFMKQKYIISTELVFVAFYFFTEFRVILFFYFTLINENSTMKNQWKLFYRRAVRVDK